MIAPTFPESEPSSGPGMASPTSSTTSSLDPMRKALVGGIDYYANIAELHGCVNDAHAVKAVLDRNSDGTVNFSVRLLTAPGPAEQISRGSLKDHVADLFSGDSEIALFYFAG